MVLNYRAANYSGWPLSRFISMVQRYKKYLKPPNISAIIFVKKLHSRNRPYCVNKWGMTRCHTPLFYTTFNV